MKRSDFVILFEICLILWLGGISIILRMTGNFEDAGLIGDSAGAINALFSALALGGVVIAIILQREELKLQRKELETTNLQLKAQKDEFTTQNDTLKRQRFENTFFQMMSLQQNIVNNLSYSYNEQQTTVTHKKNERQHSVTYLHMSENYDSDNTERSIVPITKTLTGRDVFSWLFDNRVKGAISKNGIETYSSLKYPEYFDHYFRHLYRIIKFVDKSNLIDKDDKYEYIGMIRATLSRYELVWLFYNCLSKYGKDDFKPLLEKYAMLKNLRDDLLIDDTHLSLYSQGAYKYVRENSAN